MNFVTRSAFNVFVFSARLLHLLRHLGSSIIQGQASGADGPERGSKWKHRQSEDYNGGFDESHFNISLFKLFKWKYYTYSSPSEANWISNAFSSFSITDLQQIVI